MTKKMKRFGMWKGTTLVELLVSMSIMIMAVMVTLELFSGSFFGISHAWKIDLASQIGREKLEGYLRHGYAWIQTQPGEVTGTTTVTTMAEGRSRSTIFEYSIGHKTIIAGGVHEVNVKVSWSRGGKSQNFGNSILLSSWINR